MPFPLSSENEFKMMYQALSQESLSVLLATNRQLRSNVHSLVARLTLSSEKDLKLLARHSWSQLVKLKLTGIKSAADTEELCSILAAASFTSLQYLDISYLPVTAEAMQQLAHGRWPVLTSLDLTGSFGPPDKFVNLKSVMKACRYFAAGNWPQLAVMELADNTLNSRNVKDLFCKPCPGLKTLPGLALTSLNLSCTMDPSVVEGLAKVDLQHLQVLNLSRCNLGTHASYIGSRGGEDILDALALAVQRPYVLASCDWPLLRKLDLSQNSLKDRFIGHLVHGNWPCLQELDMCDNELHEEGVKHLVKGKWPFLRQLKFNSIFLRITRVNSEALSQVFRSKWPNVVLDIPDNTW
ncbi:hypothetical protein ABBQ38_011939 [Trebouxia sp. C0009 RCD-2024]